MNKEIHNKLIYLITKAEENEKCILNPLGKCEYIRVLLFLTKLINFNETYKLKWALNKIFEKHNVKPKTFIESNDISCVLRWYPTYYSIFNGII